MKPQSVIKLERKLRIMRIKRFFTWFSFSADEEAPTL